MTTPIPLAEPIPLGTKVRIKHTRAPRSEVDRYLGPFGPNGSRIYRVQIMWKPYIDFIEVREDQLEIIGAPISGPTANGTHAPATQAP